MPLTRVYPVDLSKPTTTTDGQGNTLTTYPLLSGAWYICDPGTYAASVDALSPYKVTPTPPLQNIMAGDDAENPKGLTITLQFPDQATADPIVTAADAVPVYAPPPVPDVVPSPPRTLSLLDFKLRIPAAKRLAIRAAEATDPVIADFMDLLGSTGGATGPMVNLDDPNLQAGIAYMVSKGLLTADEQTVILA